MIGILADSAEQDVVREFFELFKTPWELYRRGQQYDVLISTGDNRLEGDAKLSVIYAGRRTSFDDEHRIRTGPQKKTACVLWYQGDRIPIYGDTVTFQEIGHGLLADADSGQWVAQRVPTGGNVLSRVGYDLFGEIRCLLTEGQPAAQAGLPALELHIAFLRDLITACGVPLVEIPPVPEGHRFIACLTHDVDHPSLRQHRWDHTAFGFLSRAVFGSLRAVLRGRMSFRALVTNWAAALKLPLIYLGIARDFWRDFGDRYLELEKGVRSTYFVIPFKNCAGKNSHGPAPAFRASRYGAQDIAGTLQELLAAGCEVGLHGLDAWLDSFRGREELEEIRRLTGVDEIGVRMHWLYYDHESPSALEKAGAAYDCTMGYNGTVGYRAGTTQVYQSLQASRLPELPLHVMDTALFYPAHLGLSPRQASTLLGRMVDNAVRFGGCLTVNWHDRSLAPERQWGACYRGLVRDLRRQDAWFATAGQAVAWFRKRRSVVFEADGHHPEAVRARVPEDHGDHLPALRLRIHNAQKLSEPGARDSKGYLDMPFNKSVEAGALCEVSR